MSERLSHRSPTPFLASAPRMRSAFLRFVAGWAAVGAAAFSQRRFGVALSAPRQKRAPHISL